MLILLSFAVHCSCLYVASVTDDLFSLPTGDPGPWRELSYDTAYSGYCVLAVCESHPHLISIGNLKGSIKLLNISDTGEGFCSVQRWTTMYGVGQREQWTSTSFIWTWNEHAVLGVFEHSSSSHVLRIFLFLYYFGEVKTYVRREGYHTLSHNICYPHPTFSSSTI